jgi:hypothetical protein
MATKNNKVFFGGDTPGVFRFEVQYFRVILHLHRQKMIYWENNVLDIDLLTSTRFYIQMQAIRYAGQTVELDTHINTSHYQPPQYCLM